MFRFSKFIDELKYFQPLGKSGLKVLSSSTLIKFQSLLLAIIFTTLFGLRGYGVFQFVIATISTISAISASGIPSLLSVAFASNSSRNISKSLRTRFSVFIFSVLILSTILTLIVTVLYGTLMPKIVVDFDNYSNITKNQFSLLIILWTPVYSVTQLYSSVFLGLKKFQYLIRLNIFKLGIYFIILICRGLFANHLFSFLILIFLVDLTFLLLQVMSSRILIRIRKRDFIRQFLFIKRIKNERAILLESALANLLIVVGLWTLQRFLVSAPDGYLSNGYFGVILRLVSIVNFIPTAYSNLLIPFFAKENSVNLQVPSFKQVFSRSIQLISIWFCAFIIATYLFEPLLASSFENLSREIIQIRWVVLLIALSQVLNTFTSNALLAAKKFKIWIKSDYILGLILLGFVGLFRNHTNKIEIAMLTTAIAYGLSGLYSLRQLMFYFRK